MKEDAPESCDGVSHCQLCRRRISNLTKHHLIPRMRHRNKKAQKQFDRRTMTARIAWPCKPCHKQVHALFSEKALAQSYHTVAALRQHPDVYKFIEWISGKPESFLSRAPIRNRLKRI